eukprot:5288330-Amphidinium_carterae.1
MAYMPFKIQDWTAAIPGRTWHDLMEHMSQRASGVPVGLLPTTRFVAAELCMGIVSVDTRIAVGTETPEQFLGPLTELTTHGSEQHQ